MQTKINRPQDDYSPDWAAYWEQNPHLMRSVGAEAAEGAGEGGEGGDGEGGNEPDLSNYVPKDAFEKLQSQLEDLQAKNREAEKHRKAKEQEARQAALESAKKDGDLEALTKSWEEKYNSSISEYQGRVSEYESMVHSLTVGASATNLAAKIAMEGCADGLKPHIQSRLKTEIVDGRPEVKVLGKDGKPSAMSLDDLEKELKATPYLAPLIKGSSASGAGGLGRGGNAGKGEISRADFDALPPAKKDDVIKKGVTIV